MAAQIDDPMEVDNQDRNVFDDVMNKFINYGKTIDPNGIAISQWRRNKNMLSKDAAVKSDAEFENVVKNNLFSITQKLKELNTGDITYKDICFSLIGYYFKVNLIDYSSEEDILKHFWPTSKADNLSNVHRLILEMSKGDHKLFQEIRRYTLLGNDTADGLEDPSLGGGGKARRSKARRSKARRSKATRSKANRSKAHRSKARRSKATRSKANRRKNIKF